MPLIIIAAVGHNGVIGNNGKLPWPKIVRDMKYFQRITTGDVPMKNMVVMGAKTFYSIGKPLKGRINLVLTRQPEKFAGFGPDVRCVDSIETVLKIAATNTVFAIGGADLYNQLIKRSEVRMMHITRVVAHFSGDTFFPEISNAEWQTVSCDIYKVSDENQYPLRFETLVRIAK